jgi:DNA modification methylase
MVGIPWRVALALQADGWYLRADIIWHKPNPMPESVTDRPTRSHEYLFLLSKSERYYYDNEAIKEPGTWSSEERKDRASENHKSVPTAQHNGIRPKPDKQRGHYRRHAGFNDRWDDMSKEEQCALMRNKRDVWTIATVPYAEAHFATFPPKLVEPCILAGSKPGDVILDPFAGTGTVGQVAALHGRQFVGIELSRDYIGLARKRLHVLPVMLGI